jgi:hypothetical protein
MKPLRFRLPLNMDPAICRPGHQDTLEIIRFAYLSIPELVRAGRPASFFHPKLRLEGDYNHIAALVTAAEGGVTFDSFTRLLRTNIKTAPIKEALTAVQALLIYLATFLFTSDETPQAKAENALSVLSEWTQNLLALAQSKMPLNLAPWQEWLYGESVRRTIIMSYALRLCYNSFKRGYCSDWLFVESLPFESRPGLWMADSPQAWIAAAHVKTGEEVGEKLNSVHEFAEIHDRTQGFCGDLFLKILAYVHNGNV